MGSLPLIVSDLSPEARESIVPLITRRHGRFSWFKILSWLEPLDLQFRGGQRSSSTSLWSLFVSSRMESARLASFASEDGIRIPL